MKKGNLHAKIQHDIKIYFEALNSGILEDRLWAVEVLGRQHFCDSLTIPEIMEDLEKSYHTEHHWFVKSINKLEFYIRHAIYNGMFPVDEVDSFFYTVYNEKEILEAMNNREKSETLFDGVWDFYVKVLNKLNYIN